MLDNEKKSLIEQEELYRHEVASRIRSEIGTIKKEVKSIEEGTWKRIYELFNTNLGIWLLSTIVISGGAAIYQKAQHQYESRIHVRKELITCQFEITNRLHNMAFLLRRAKTVGDAQYALTPVTKGLGSVKPEFQNINIAALYFNEFQLTGKRNSEVAENIKTLEELNFVIQSQDPKAIFSEDDRKQLLKIISELAHYETAQIETK